MDNSLKTKDLHHTAAARSGQGRGAAERTLDSEDRSGIMHGEVKEDFATRPALRRVKATPAVRSGSPILQARRSLDAVGEWAKRIERKGNYILDAQYCGEASALCVKYIIPFSFRVFPLDPGQGTDHR